MSKVSVAPGDLAGLDALNVDGLALYLHKGRRQPRGVPGHVDWRLSGKISRLILEGRFAGERDEVLLMPGRGRVGADRIFLVGLGEPDPALAMDRGVGVLTDAGSRRVAIGGPGSALIGWFAAATPERFDEVVVLGADGSLDGVVDAVEAGARRTGFRWGGP